MTKNDGGPAFPTTRVVGSHGEYSAEYEGGMSLRDWFAGQAIKGMAPRIYDAGYPQEMDVMEVVWATRTAYVIADAMLAEREARDA